MLRQMQRLLDTLIPPTCAGCSTEGSVLCPDCKRVFSRRLDEPPGLPIGLPANGHPPGLAQLEWCSTYSGPARDCLHAFKYDGEQRLAGPLGRLMAERWRKAGIGGEVVVPVPVHAARRRERGFDQAELLARSVGIELGLPVSLAVRRSTRTAAQHALGRGARRSNVGRVFVVAERQLATVQDRWVLLVDDVTTTGATLAACAEALAAAGARAVSGLTLFRER